MTSDVTGSRSTSTFPGVEAAEHERQFREMLEFCPAALLVVDDDGRLLFHNARLREILGYSKDVLDLCDTRMHWHDLEQRDRIIDRLRERGGQILNEKVAWRTKKGTLVHLLLSYVQVAYRGGHVSFVGGKRIAWVYDVTALTEHQAQVGEQERQLREILDFCPAGLSIVDEDGRLLFHNRRLRALLGYEKDELHLFDTRANNCTTTRERARARHGVIRAKPHQGRHVASKTVPAKHVERSPTRRCGAKTRLGRPCIRKALANGRWRNHGGMSTGPRTREGRARISEMQKQRWDAFRSARMNVEARLE